MQQCAQVLLTLDNLADRNQYLNASNTFQELLQMGTIPIVNENDTVAVQQLRFGDNDTLSAEVSTDPSNPLPWFRISNCLSDAMRLEMTL